jgi:hypothetical protein
VLCFASETSPKPFLNQFLEDLIFANYNSEKETSIKVMLQVTTHKYQSQKKKKIKLQKRVEIEK